MTIPFPTVGTGQPLRLDLVERGHAALGSFQRLNGEKTSFKLGIPAKLNTLRSCMVPSAPLSSSN